MQNTSPRVVGRRAGEAGIVSRELGAIEIADRYALVEVPEVRADEIVAVMKKATLRGQKVQVRRDREGRREVARQSRRKT